MSRTIFELISLFLFFLPTIVVAKNKTLLNLPSGTALLDGPASVVEACQEDYSPCTCYSYSNPPTLDVFCSNVPSFVAVQAVFRRTSTMQIKQFSFTVPPAEVNNTIPADFLSGKSAQLIYITCPSTETKLRIDSKAFNSSRDYMAYIKIISCDLSQLDYQFLADSFVLTELQYARSINVDSQWAEFPFLPSLVLLGINDSPDFDGFQNLPLSKLPALNQLTISLCPKFQILPIISSLTILKIDSCPFFNSWDVVTQLGKLDTLSLINFDNETIHDALNSIVSSPLSFKLMSLTISQNGLTQIPPQIKLLSQLESINMLSNKISTAINGSLAFTRMPRSVDLSSNGLTTIEPAAFQGDFGVCQLRLERNSLTRFESSVFKSMVESMTTGMVYINENPIECDCHLAWLFQTPYLRDRVYGGSCADGTYFSSLTPQDFAKCPGNGENPSTIRTTTEAVSPPDNGGTTTMLFRSSTFALAILFSFLSSWII